MRLDLPPLDGALRAEVDPDIFYPDKGDSNTNAKRICAACEVREPCLDWAISNGEKFGIWGGASDRNRRTIAAERGIPYQSTYFYRPLDDARPDTAA